MNYNLICPSCQQWHYLPWANVANQHSCPATKANFTPPRPKDQTPAWVDQHDWPPEMETAVFAIKGNKCCVPGCTKNSETLDHRVPWSKGGKTSVENLWPMCKDHNSAKGDTDWATWLASI